MNKVTPLGFFYSFSMRVFNLQFIMKCVRERECFVLHIVIDNWRSLRITLYAVTNFFVLLNE